VAVRFDADAESYTRATGLTTVTDFTFACWVKLAADRATTTAILQIDNGSGTGRMRINAFNGTQLTFQSDGTTWFGNFGLTLAVGTWTYVALSATANPGQVRTAARAAGSATCTSATSSQANITMNAATLRIGDGQAASEWLNGSVAAVKVWSAALTVAELEQESWTYLPCRTSGLRGWYPLLTPSTVDYSGQAQTLSGGSGAAADDGPPLTWSSQAPIIIRSTAVPGIDGTLDAVLPALTATAAGTVKTTGTLAATLPPLAAAAAATVKTAGTFTTTLPSLAATLTGTVGGAGVLTATLPPLTASMQGTVRGGFLLPVLPALTATATGVVRFTGTLSATLPPLTAQLAGAVVIPPFDLVAVAGPPQHDWGSRPPGNEWAAGTATTPWAAHQPATTWNASPAEPAWAAGPPTT
jgi:hypothetical protein